ncbi:MarR family winged helix-turn-helix transcriptional regulator [Rhodococcus pyridinivorans]|uniref:MarR family winged helix-turn-helix transcriptional regulator n=1 Tax=Rhodococcus pyridinivorans TaxID=103816 RepID=UPI003083C3BB
MTSDDRADPLDRVRSDAARPTPGEHQQPQRGRHSLDRSTYTVLSRISMQGPMSIGQLSDALDLDSSTLNRHISAMTAAGLVEHIPDPDGSTARKFRITSSGEECPDASPHTPAAHGSVAGRDHRQTGTPAVRVMPPPSRRRWHHFRSHVNHDAFRGQYLRWASSTARRTEVPRS